VQTSVRRVFDFSHNSWGPGFLKSKFQRTMSRWVLFKWIHRHTIPSGCLEIEDGYEPWGRSLFNWMALAIICLSYTHRPVCSVDESMSCFGVLVRELSYFVLW
jgi:hypothetical protein